MNIEGDSAKSVNTKFTLTSNNAMSQLVYCFTEVAQNQISGPWIDWLVPLVTLSINPCTPKDFSRICRFFSRHVLMYWWGQWGTLFWEATSRFVVVVYERRSISESIRHRVISGFFCSTWEVTPRESWGSQHLPRLTTTWCLGRKILK